MSIRHVVALTAALATAALAASARPRRAVLPRKDFSALPTCGAFAVAPANSVATRRAR